MRNILVLLSLLIAFPCWGATITVCGSGCDQTTIQGALNAVAGNDTINISSGTYTELLTFGATQSGKNLTINGGVGGGTTTLTNASTTLSHQKIQIGADYTSGTIVFNNITVSGVARAIRYYGIGNLTFNNCVIGGSDYYIYASSATTGGSLTFNNCTLSHTGAATAITLYTGQNLSITGSTITAGTGNFISISGGITIGNISITNSTIDASDIGADYKFLYVGTGGCLGILTFKGNFLEYKLSTGFTYTRSATSAEIAENTIINTSASTASIAIGLGVDGATTTSQINKVICRLNKVYFNGAGHSHGILIGRGVVSGEVHNNYVYGGDYLYVIKSDNVNIHHNVGVGSSGDIAGIYLRCGSNNKIFNNTLYLPNGHGFQIDTQTGGATPSSNQIKNNIFYVMAAGVYGIRDFTGAADGNADQNIFDNNIYYMQGGGSIASLNYGATPPTVIGTLANLKTAWATYSASYPTNDANSLSSDPLFISSTNYHLQAGSPARGAGTNVGLVHIDPPDIGAEPYVQYVPWAK